MQYRQYRTTCGGRGQCNTDNTDNTELHVGERSMQYRQYRTTCRGEVDAKWLISKQNSLACCSMFEHLLGGRANECLNN